MPNTVIYYPLLKKGFQELVNTDNIEAEIATLQNSVNDLQADKVSKALTAADLNNIADTEIFQWQGNDTTIEGNSFKNGFFYKKTITPTVVVNAGDKYLFVTPEIANSFDGHTIESGYYTFVEQTEIAFNGIVACERNLNYYTFKPATVGQAVLTSNNRIVVGGTIEFVEWLTVAAINDNRKPTQLSDGTAFYAEAESMGNGFFSLFKNKNGTIINCGIGTVGSNSITCVADADFFPIAPMCYIIAKIAPSDIVENVVNYTAVDVQAGLVNIANDSNNNVNISANLDVSGDLTVNGTQTVVITQEVDSENDNINLRYNNPLGLENGAESGVKVLNYDGNNTNCFLGVDNQGWARVGDENGTLQKLATIEENPTNGEFVAYNTTTKQLESKTLQVTSITAAGLCPQLPNDATTTKYLREDGTWVKPPNTTYSSKTAASGGTDVSLCTTGEKYTWNNKSVLSIGTTASTAAAGNHTHNINIATDTGTNQLTLSPSTKYKLTAGGKSFIFTTPSSGAPTVTSGSSSLSGGGYAWAKYGNVATLKLTAGVAAGTYTLPSGVPKPNALLNTITNGAKIKITTTQLIVTSGYQAEECITYICQ